MKSQHAETSTTKTQSYVCINALTEFLPPAPLLLHAHYGEVGRLQACSAVHCSFIQSQSPVLRPDSFAWLAQISTEACDGPRYCSGQIRGGQRETSSHYLRKLSQVAWAGRVESCEVILPPGHSPGHWDTFRGFYTHPLSTEKN